MDYESTENLVWGICSKKSLIDLKIRILSYYSRTSGLAHSLGAVDHYHNSDGENGECTVGNRCTECGTFMHKRTPFCAVNYDYYDDSEPFCNECVIEMKASVYFKCYPETTTE